MRKRNIKYETIRVIAMIFVVIIHELSMFVEQSSYSYLIIGTFLFTANSLFFMLSGKFAFDIDYEENNYVLKYYYKKLVGFFIPVLIYMFIRQFFVMYIDYDMSLLYSIKVYIPKFIHHLIFVYPHSEYWFLYNLAALFLIVPFIGKFITNASKKNASIFIGLIMLVNTSSTILGYYNTEYNFVYSYVGRSIYFFLGYFIDKFYSNKKSKKIIYILGIISFIITTILFKVTTPVNIWTYSLTFTLFSIMVFTFIRDKINLNKIKKIILLLGKYSLSIYMVHMIFIKLFNSIIPKGNMNSYIYALIIVILTILFSLGFGIIIDNILVKRIKNKLNNKAMK